GETLAALVRLPTDVEQLNALEVLRFDFGGRIRSGYTQRWPSLVPERPAVALSFNQEKQAGFLHVRNPPLAITDGRLARWPTAPRLGLERGPQLGCDQFTGDVVVGDLHTLPAVGQTQARQELNRQGLVSGQFHKRDRLAVATLSLMASLASGCAIRHNAPRL